jgi:DNA recombination protein RmuC
MNELNRTVDSKLGESTKMVQSAVTTQFTESQKLIREITRELTEVKETGKQVVSFADQLQSLQDILKNPKQRGVLGEYFLETLLKNVLPEGSYGLQYGFPDGSKVDAVIFVKDKIIPIDSKFSLENYNRLAEEKNQSERERLERLFKSDIKNRIDETSKYIQPNNNTLDFAIMFIPSETIYYDLTISQVGNIKVNTQDLIEYAAGKRVSIVSPNSFYAFLQTILQGLKMFKIEERTKDIIKNVEKLDKHIGAFDEFMKSLGNSLGSTVNHYNKAYKELGKVNKDVLKITGESSEIEVLEIERPEKDEE